MEVVGEKLAIRPQKPRYDWVFGVKCPFFHELHLLFILSVDLLLNFDYFQPSGTFLDLFGARVEHNFAPLWTN